MINSREANALNIPETTIKEVIFKRKNNHFEYHDDRYNLLQCIAYLENCGLKSDDVVTTHKHYIFAQNLCITDARFVYKKRQPGIFFVYQNYRYSNISDVSSE
jgi:hypothetical protein